MRLYNLCPMYKPRQKRKICLLLVVISLFILIPFSGIVLADSESETTVKLSQATQDIINNFNFDGLDIIISGLEENDILTGNIEEELNKILSGKYYTDYGSILKVLLSTFFISVGKYLPIILSIISIGIIGTILTQVKSDYSASGTINFVSLSIVVIILIAAFGNVFKSIDSTIESLSNQMSLIFPILLTLLSSVGSLTSVSIYNPLVAVLSTITTIIFKNCLYPIFILIFVLTILSNLTDTVKLDKMIAFLSSSFKWLVGIIFTLFFGFLSIQGVSAGKFDTISIKATKFAVKSYIPIIGSYVAEGMDFIVLGSVLVKNAIGLLGIVILILSILSPIINMVIFKLGLQLSSGVLEMTGNNKLSSFLSSVAKILVLPIVVLIGISFMYILSLSLIIVTSNIF